MRMTARIRDTAAVTCSDGVGSAAPRIRTVTLADTSGFNGVLSLLTSRAVIVLFPSGMSTMNPRSYARGS